MSIQLQIVNVMDQQGVAKQVTKIREAQTATITSSFVWEVENWADIKEKFIQSATIEIPDIDGCFWISLFPKVVDENDPREVSKTVLNFNLKLKSDVWKSNKYEYEVFCTNPNIPMSRRQLFHIPSTAVDQDMITKTKPVDTSITSIAIVRTNSFVMEFKIIIKYFGSKVVRSKFFDPNALKNDIMMKVRTICSDPTFADFVFLIKGKEFKVHKNILAAASSVMHRMFTNNMEESKSNVCKLDQFEPEVFGKFLDCIYNGKVGDDFTNFARDIYSIADYYGVDKLKELAKNEVSETIDVTNAFDVFKWSLQYSCDEILADAWEIIKRCVQVHLYFFKLKVFSSFQRCFEDIFRFEERTPDHRRNR